MGRRLVGDVRLGWLSVAPGNVSPAQVASAVLKGVGAPVNPNTVASMVGWMNAEGGHWHNAAAYNPLNTTLNAPGARAINSAGVKAYGNWQQGIGATVQTLRQPNMAGIVQALRSSNPQAVARAIGSSPWGTSAQTVAQTIAQALKGGTTVPATSGMGAGVAPQAQPASTQTVPTFDQKGFDQAQARYIAGRLVSQTDSSSPWDIGPKGADIGPNPLLSTGLLTTTAPNPADFQGTKTIQDATGKLQQIAGIPLANVHAGARGYVNPIPGAVIGRTDMGVDATLKPGAPIRAIGNSRVVAISPNWYAGQPYVQLQLLDGPQKGRYYYVAEQITPAVRPGQTVKAGQPIGTYAPSGTGIEIGWGSPTPGRTQAQATTGYSEGEQTAAGQNFRAFLGNLK